MRIQKKSYSPRSFSRGVGLIEVLVAVLIMGVGLLGIAAMQATALRNSQSALERSQAVILSYTILDAMRANPTAARASSYNMGETCAVPTATATLAEKDKHDWIDSLRALGEGTCGTATCVNDVCTVIVKWNDSRGTSLGGSDNAAARTVTTTTRI